MKMSWYIYSRNVKISKKIDSKLNYSKKYIFIFEAPWRTTTFVVPQNELHNAINHHMIQMNLETSKQKCYTILIIDIYKNI
jgi:hypothetical protein